METWEKGKLKICFPQNFVSFMNFQKQFYFSVCIICILTYFNSCTGKVCAISFEQPEASPYVYSASAIIGLSLLNSILMARFLKQSFAQTCPKETDNGKLQQFNYSRSLITNRGTVESGIGRMAKNYYAPLGRET